MQQRHTNYTLAYSVFLLRLPEIDTALQVLSEILQQLTNQKSSIEEVIHATFEELQKTLNVRKSVLLMELEVNYGLKQKASNYFLEVYLLQCLAGGVFTCE